MRVCFRYWEPVALLRCSCWELAACRSWEYVVCAGAYLVGRERSSKSRVDGRWVSEQAQRVEHLCSPTRESLRRASAAIPMGHLARVGAPGQRGNAQPYLLPAHCQSLISRHLGARLRDIAALFAPTCPPGANLRSAAEPARRSLQLERRHPSSWRIRKEDRRCPIVVGANDCTALGGINPSWSRRNAHPTRSSSLSEQRALLLAAVGDL